MWVWRDLNKTMVKPKNPLNYRYRVPIIKPKNLKQTGFASPGSTCLACCCVNMPAPSSIAKVAVLYGVLTYKINNVDRHGPTKDLLIAK